MKIQQMPGTHLQPTVMETKPPRIGPSIGPMNGAVANMDDARPRRESGKRSAITPPALVRGKAPKAPARKRKTSRDAIFLQPADAPMKAAIRPCETTNGIFRPYNSDSGAYRAGPMANPSTKRAIPAANSSLLVWNSAMIWSAEAEYADDVRVTAKTEQVTMDAVSHLRQDGKVMGL